MKSLLPTSDQEVGIKEVEKMDDDTLDEIVNISNPFKELEGKFTDFQGKFTDIQSQFKDFPNLLKNLGKKNPHGHDSSPPRANQGPVPVVTLNEDEPVPEYSGEYSGGKEDEVIVDLDISEEELIESAQSSMVKPPSIGMDKGIMRDDYEDLA
jgi:hypothetical protein